MDDHNDPESASKDNGSGAGQPMAVEYCDLGASEQFEPVLEMVESALDMMPESVGDLTQERYGMIRGKLDKIRDIATDNRPRVLKNYNMPVDEVKSLILKECAAGKPFYPSDVAKKHEVNYDTVDEAVEQLRKEGRIAEPSSQVMAAKTHEEVIKEIRHANLVEIADRVEYLRGLVADDSDGVDFDLKSLRHMASLFLSHSGLPTPQIVVDDAGCAHATWRIPDRGIIIMVFLPSGMVKYSGIFQPAESGGQQWNTRGTLPPEQATETLWPFLSMQITN